MKFRIKIKTKGTSDVFIIPLSKKEAETYSDSELKALFGPGASEREDFWVLDGAIGDEADILFEVNVYDEKNVEVYSSKKDRKKFYSFFMDGDPNEKLYELRNPKYSGEDNYKVGYYLVKNLIDKWREYTYEIEDDKFHPEWLRYTCRDGYYGLLYDYWTDCNHMTYNCEFLELKDELENDVIDSFGYELSIFKKEKIGRRTYWEFIRNVDL